MQAAALLATEPGRPTRESTPHMAGNMCRCGTYQRIRAAIKDAAGGTHERRSPTSLAANVPRATSSQPARFVARRRVCSAGEPLAQTVARRRRPLWQAGRLSRHRRRRQRRRSSPIGRRWARASAPACRWSSPRNSTPTGRASASNRPSATPSTDRRTPTAPARSATSTTRCASPARAPGSCWSRRPPPQWSVPVRRCAGTEPRRRPHAERADAGLRRARRRRRPSCLCPTEVAALQGGGRVPLHRQDVPIADLDDLVTRQGHVRHRRAHAGDGLRGDRAAAGSTAARSKSVDDAAAQEVAACQTVVRLPRPRRPRFQALGGVAVIADNTWAALKGRESAEGGLERQRRTPPSTPPPTAVAARNRARAGQGAAERRRRRRGLRVRRRGRTRPYTTPPMLAHAPMEPPAAVAEFSDGKVVTWAATQNPQAVQEAVAAALGIKKEDVTCHVTLLGGGFGRKSKPDYVVEAALLSKQVGKPVKVVWSREDDMHFDYFHAPAAHVHEGGLDADGLPTAWLHAHRFSAHRLALEARGASTAAGRPNQGWTEIPFHIAEPARRERPGAGAHPHRLAALGGEHPPRLRRPVFTDELAALAKARSVEYLLEADRRAARHRLRRRGHAGWKNGEPKHRLRHRPATPRHRARRREVGLGEQEVGQPARLRARRALELPLLHRRRRRSRSRTTAARSASRASTSRPTLAR